MTGLMGSEIESKGVNEIESRNVRSRSQWRRCLVTPMVCSIFASLGIFGGISALVIGMFAVVIHCVIPGDRIFNGVGTVLLIVAIPMILVGSIFLDEINQK